MFKKIVLLTFVFVFFGSCTQKEGGAPTAWQEWKASKVESFAKKFSAPTITHHIYLAGKGDRAFVDLNGPFPRFVKKACEKCEMQVEMISGKVVSLNVKGMEDKIELIPEKTTPITNSESLFVTAYPYEDEGKIRVFIHDMKQPGLAKKRKRNFFSYDDKWKKEAQFYWLEKPMDVVIQRSDGSAKKMKKVAAIKMSLMGKETEFSIYNSEDNESYKEEDETMLLYRDFSNGEITYGAGRFLYVQFPKTIGKMKDGDSVEVDFNFSFNPPCAVSTGYHCPLPQDLAKLPIEVGEKYKK